MAKRLLIVDDDPAIGSLLRRTFQKRNYETLYTDNGVDALQMAQSQELDLILLDMDIPKMDGLKVLQALHDKLLAATQGKGRWIPIILITGNQDVEKALEAMKLGACDYITKPFDIPYLERMVERTLNPT